MLQFIENPAPKLLEWWEIYFLIRSPKSGVILRWLRLKVFQYPQGSRFLTFSSIAVFSVPGTGWLHKL